MAAPKVQINIEGLDRLSDQLKELGKAGGLAGLTFSALSNASKEMAVQIRNASMQIGKTGSGIVSAGEYNALVEKFSRCSQRMTLLLSLISAAELKRLGLLPPDAPEEADAWDKVCVLKELDKRVETFNAAHQRLTGKRKKLALDTGKIELSQEEMAMVFAGRAAGRSTQEMIKEIEALRKKV